MPEPQSVKGAELAFLALLLRRASIDAQRDATLTGDERSSFFRAACKYYRASRRELEALCAAGVSFDELPVILYVARCSALKPMQVLTMRRGGRSWAAMLEDLHLSPEVLYVPVTSPIDVLPVESAAHYESAAREAWNVLLLRDTDVVNLINMKFISEHHGFRPEQVVALRSAGWSFVAIHAAVAGPKPVEKQRPRRAKQEARGAE